jgi:Arc/MetJ-type ribon-helix-helix transcriptional regulator
MENDTLTQLLAGLSKPSPRFRKMTVRITDKEFLGLQAYAAGQYLNYSDVVRAALAAFLSTDNTPEQI